MFYINEHSLKLTMLLPRTDQMRHIEVINHTEGGLLV